MITNTDIYRNWKPKPTIKLIVGDSIDEVEQEQRRLHAERIGAMREEVDRIMSRPHKVQSQFVEEQWSQVSRGIREDIQQDGIRQACINRLVFATGTLQSVPASEELIYSPAILPPKRPLQSLLLYFVDLDRLYDQLLGYEMLYRDLPCTEQVTRGAKIRATLQHQLP